MKNSSMFGIFVSVLTTLPIVLGTLTLMASDAEAKAGYRMCYYAYGGEEVNYFFMRKRNNDFGTSYDCSSEYDKVLAQYGKDMPSLYRDGAYRDMSICENFTKYILEVDNGKDICDYIETWKSYVKDDLIAIVE